ncbi:hypothetical protein NCC49_000728 [Naganishia albida]|nr:hypothetical protein NCC49_000728 [Naganishia albida]
MPSSAAGTRCDERAGPSKTQTWKDKPGMAKKRKRANVRPGWNIIEVDDDDEDVISSGDIVTGPRPSTSGLKSNSNGDRRRPIYDIDSSSQGDSSSESAQETDDDGYDMPKSQRSRAKSSKKKGKQLERHKSPVSKKKHKAKEGKTGRAVKKRALSQDPEIQEIALSSLDNSVFVIDAILSAQWGKYSEAKQESWLYTIKWHGFTIAQTAHEEPIPALNFGGDGSVITEFWRDLDIPTDRNCVTRNEEGYLIFEPRRQSGEIKASPVSLVRWHISAYRRYKEDSLRFVKRLKRLEGEGARLDKATIDEIRVLKRYKAEVLAHLEDARREIDLNERACRRAGLQGPDPDEVEEEDIDTDEALGDTGSTTDEPSPPKKKRKSSHHGYDDHDDRPSQSSRPGPKKKVRPEEQQAKNAFKAKFMQEEPAPKTGIKLKIPMKSLSPEVTKQKKDPHIPLPAKSPEKRPPKSDDARTPKVGRQEHRAVPYTTPREEPVSKSSDNRPKPRKRMKGSASGSPVKEPVVPVSREGNQPKPQKRDNPISDGSATPREKSLPPPPVAPIAAFNPTLSASRPAPLFLEAADISKRAQERPAQWALGAESPAANKTIHDVPQTGKTAEEAVVVDSFPSPDLAPPLVVKDEPQSPVGAYSGSEGEVEHDLGLDTVMSEPVITTAPEPIVVEEHPPPRPLPDTSGTTLYLRFDNDMIGRRNIGKVRLQSISDPRRIGDPMAMFESLFFGGDKELVVDQAIMNAMGGQTVNQFARIRPDNPSSRQEINKLTIHMQDKRQPLGVVRVREDLLIVIYSSKSANSAILGTPRDIRASAGFTMAAVFPSRDFNIRVNPAIRPPTVLSPEALVLPQEPAAGPGSDVTPSHARPSPVNVPITSGTRETTTPGITQTVTSLIAGPADEVHSPSRVVGKDANDRNAADLDMDIDWDIDVDLGLDMDLDPVQDEKPRLSPSSEAVQRPVIQRSARLGVTAPRGLISAQTLARPTARPTTVSPAVSAGNVTVQRKETTPSSVQEIEQPPARLVPPSQIPAVHQDHTETVTGIRKSEQQDQPAIAKTVPPLSIEATTTVAPISQAPRIEESFTPSELAKPAAAVVSAPIVNAAPVEELAQVPVSPASLPPVPEDTQTIVAPPAGQPTLQERLQDEAVEKPQDAALDQSEPIIANGHVTVGSAPPPAPRSADTTSDQPMIIDSPSMQAKPIAVEAAMDEQAVEVSQPALPLSSPPPMPFASALPSPPPPSPPASSNGVQPAPPSISPPPLPQSSPVREVPPPGVSHAFAPSEPDVVAISHPEEPAKEAPTEKYIPTPDDSLPVVPPVPAGGGKLQFEVVIDETEFANSTDGYFKRFCADIHPQDLHPNDTLAAYGFTKA